ncbi:hypothetical protein TIFTF001_015903 [Ficus carica]|uniref:Uncharacterized protein n=1 Tax=Ficus carica TaxID=3494 RepID=A0AA87ZZH0_FICCA|nr:hypothetical protein TIFTF001_015903 [Ficus carica]
MCRTQLAHCLLKQSSTGAFRGLGCSGRPGRVGYGITQVAAGGDVTRCRSGQATPVADGTCVRKGVTGGARAPRALSLWNVLARGGSSGILVGWPAHTGRRGTPARRRGPSAD